MGPGNGAVPCIHIGRAQIGAAFAETSKEHGFRTVDMEISARTFAGIAGRPLALAEDRKQTC